MAAAQRGQKVGGQPNNFRRLRDGVARISDWGVLSYFVDLLNTKLETTFCCSF